YRIRLRPAALAAIPSIIPASTAIARTGQGNHPSPRGGPFLQRSSRHRPSKPPLWRCAAARLRVPKRTLHRQYRLRSLRRHRLPGSFGDTSSKWIRRVQDQFGYCSDVSAAFDGGMKLAIYFAYRTFEDAPDNTLLPPGLSSSQFAIRIETGQSRARSRATRRPVVRFARAQNEVLAVGKGPIRWPKQGDVVDLVAISAGNPIAVEGLPDLPCELG